MQCACFCLEWCSGIPALTSSQRKNPSKNFFWEILKFSSRFSKIWNIWFFVKLLTSDLESWAAIIFQAVVAGWRRRAGPNGVAWTCTICVTIHYIQIIGYVYCGCWTEVKYECKGKRKECSHSLINHDMSVYIISSWMTRCRKCIFSLYDSVTTVRHRGSYIFIRFDILNPAVLRTTDLWFSHAND